MCDLRRAGVVIVYPIGDSGQVLTFSPDVIDRFRAYQQLRWWQREAGGQLFARFTNGLIEVVAATGPRRTDRRGRYRYEPDRRSEQVEIDDRFSLGLHFVGDWHTHPEDRPQPSGVDLSSTGDGVRRSLHSLNAFLMVIVGRRPLPDGMYVCLHDGRAGHELRPRASG